MKKILLVNAFILSMSGYTCPMEPMDPKNPNDQIEIDFNRIRNQFLAYSNNRSKTEAMRFTLIKYVDHIGENAINDDQQREIVDMFDCINPQFTIPKIVQDDEKLGEIDRVAKLSHVPYESYTS